MHLDRVLGRLSGASEMTRAPRRSTGTGTRHGMTPARRDLQHQPRRDPARTMTTLTPPLAPTHTTFSHRTASASHRVACAALGWALGWPKRTSCRSCSTCTVSARCRETPARRPRTPCTTRMRTRDGRRISGSARTDSGGSSCAHGSGTTRWRACWATRKRSVAKSGRASASPTPTPTPARTTPRTSPSTSRGTRSGGPTQPFTSMKKSNETKTKRCTWATQRIWRYPARTTPCSHLNAIETPKPLSLECPKAAESVERPAAAEVSTSEPWPGQASASMPPASWPTLAPDAYLQATRHKIDGENLPSSTDTRN